MALNSATEFPAFLTLRFDDSGRAQSEFQRAVNDAMDRAEDRIGRFNATVREVGGVIRGAIAGGLNGFGGLDLGVGKFRQAAAEARLLEAALNENLAAAQRLAAATGDTSGETRDYIKALQAEKNAANLAAEAADQQVTTYTRLQGALDATAQKGSALADAYRSLYIEQARAAQVEVSQRSIQTGLNNAYAPALNARAVDNGAGYSALIELERRNSALETQAQEYDRLRAAEAGAAEGARLLAAVERETGLALDNAGRSARESAELFIQLAAAQNDIAQRNFQSFAAPALTSRAVDNGASFQALDERARAAERYGAILNELRSQIDPVWSAEQRRLQIIEALDFAEQHLGLTESQRTQLMDRMQAEYERNVNSTRAQRFAYIQLGQQLQDVAVQAQLGVNPLIILTQQGTQAAYALSGLGGTVGRVATWLSGPWGAALTIATVALGSMIVSMQDAEKASKSLGDGLDFQKMSVFELIKAINQLEAAQKGQIRTSYEAEQAKRADAKAALDAASADLEQAKAVYELLKAQSAKLPTAGYDRATAAGLRATITTDLAAYDAIIGALSKAQENAGKLLRETEIPIVQRQASAAVDPRKRVELQYEEKQALTNQLYAAGAITLDTYTKSTNALTAAREKDLNALKKHTDAQAASDRLAERGEDASKKISNITDQFANIPSQIVKVNRAMRELNDLADDFARKKPPNYQEILAKLAQAQSTVQGALNQPFQDYVEKAQQQAVQQQLIGRGRLDEAAALQAIVALQKQQGPLSRDQLSTILRMAVAEREQNEQIERRKKLRDQDVQAVRSVEAAIQGSIADIRSQGIRALGNLFDNIMRAFEVRLSQQIMDKIFGSLFDDLTKQFQGVKSASEEVLIKALLEAGVKVEAFGNAVGAAANVAVGTEVAKTDSTTAADNAIKVIANPTSAGTFETIFIKLFSRFLGDNSPLAKILGKLSATILEGAAIGGAAGSLILGSNNSKTGSAIGGALGELAGKEIGKKVGGLLGDALGPLGAIAGGLLGGLFGGLFAPPKPRGAAQVTSVNGAPVVTGTGQAEMTAASSVATSLQSSLNRIIEQLGGSAGSFAVSIGKREDYYRVSKSGSDAVGNKTYVDRMPWDVAYNGTDASEALRIAILDAINDGAVQGIREGSKRLLEAGQDLDTNLTKALRFEQVFKDLKKLTDPVGAALDELNLQFRQLKDIFDQAGASTQEYAQLQDLYTRQRAQAVKEAAAQLTEPLESLLKDLTQGDNGLSLRSRLASAQATYNDVSARVSAGDTTAFSEFGDASRTLLDIERQLYGSQSQYFDVLKQVTDFTKGTLADQQAKIDAASAAGSPFDTAPIVTATQTQTQQLLDGLTPALNSIAASNASLYDLIRSGVPYAQAQQIVATRGF